MLRTMGSDTNRSVFQKGCLGYHRNAWEGKEAGKQVEPE